MTTAPTPQRSGGRVLGAAQPSVPWPRASAIPDAPAAPVMVTATAREETASCRCFVPRAAGSLKTSPPTADPEGRWSKHSRSSCCRPALAPQGVPQPRGFKPRRGRSHSHEWTFRSTETPGLHCHSRGCQGGWGQSPPLRARQHSGHACTYRTVLLQRLYQ